MVCRQRSLVVSRCCGRPCHDGCARQLASPCCRRLRGRLIGLTAGCPPAVPEEQAPILPPVAAEPHKPRKKDPILPPAPWPQYGNRKAAGPRKKARVASPTASMSIAG